MFQTKRRIVVDFPTSGFAKSGILEQAHFGFVSLEIVELFAQLGKAREISFDLVHGRVSRWKLAKLPMS